MIKIDEIKQFAQRIGVKDDLLGSFLSSFLSGRTSDYITVASRIIYFGYIQKHNPNLDVSMDKEIVNSNVLHDDLARSLPQTMPMLAVIIRKADYTRQREILETCIEMLFDVGYKYDGTDLSGTTSPISNTTNPPLTIADQTPDFELPDEISDFLNGIL